MHEFAIQMEAEAEDALEDALEDAPVKDLETKLREAWLLVVRVEEDRIISHGIVRSRLIVELDFKVIRARRVQVYGGNFAMFEVAITEPWPPLVRDVQAETYQCLSPFRADRDVWNNGARHHEQKGM